MRNWLLAIETGNVCKLGDLELHFPLGLTNAVGRAAFTLLHPTHSTLW
jgi:hypothetical protein